MTGLAKHWSAPQAHGDICAPLLDFHFTLN